MRGKFIIQLLAVTMVAVMAVSILPSAVNAQEPDKDRMTVEEAIDVDESVLADNEMLFEEYAKSVFSFDASEEISHVREYGLTEKGLKIFKYLKKEISDIAAGNRKSTQITIGDATGEISWSYEELGLALDAGWEGEEGIPQRIEKAIVEEIDAATIYRALLHDSPYELYWHTKGIKNSMSLEYSMEKKIVFGDQKNSKIIVRGLTFRFVVDQAYCGYNIYTTDTDKTSRAIVAAENAREIVEKYKDYSDYEKLLAYKEEICSLVEYNEEAIEVNYDIEKDGIDPWQLIYVFDKDPTTDVVCEGYAKAFQYLCNLSAFHNIYVSCISVSGEMIDEEEISGHMWNVVRMNDKKNYTADITNSEEWTIGEDGRLFLAGAKGNVEEGYSYNIIGGEITYAYDKYMKKLFPKERLELASYSYDPASIPICEHTKTEVQKKTESTCIAAGYTGDQVCTDCGDILERGEVIPISTEHAWEDFYRVDVKATCLRAGQRSMYCSLCDAVKETVTIPKLKPTIKLSATKKTIRKKKSYTLKISKLGEGDSVKSVKSGKKSVATVKKVKTNQYKITGKKKGKATITVVLQSGKKATCKIKVK